MSRQLEQASEDRNHRRQQKILEAVEYGLDRAVQHSGGELTGLAIKYNGGDVLLVVKVVLAGKRQVAFVGADDLGSGLVKVVREGLADRLKWREDRYGGES